MKRIVAQLCCLLLWCAATWLQAAEEPPTLVAEAQGDGEVDFNPRTGAISAANGVIVRYGTAYLTARKATLNQTTGEVLAEGNVHVEQEGQTWSGDRIIYNFKTRQITTGEFRTGQAPFFVRGPGVDVSLTNRIYVATNAWVTTDDYAEPAHEVHAKRITVVPGRYIEAKGATVWLGKVPVFYMPMLYRSMEHHPNFWVLVPGYRSLYGPYLLSSYHWVWSDQLDTGFNIDYRVKRGVGVGPDIEWESPALGSGKLRYYYLNDQQPGDSPQTFLPLPDNRQRLWFSHQTLLRTNLTLKAMVRYQSDPYVVRDFFETEYRENVQPSTFVEANQDWRNWNLNLEVQPRVNEFQETIERLPDLKLTGLRQELGHSPFYYETESSFGYFRHLFPEDEPGYVYPLPYEAARADTYHQIVAPFTFFGWLNLIPRVGQRFSYYSKATGPGATTDEEGRAVFNTGIETTFKLSRVWRGTHSSFLDVDGMRHIAEPSVNYAYVPNPSPASTRLPQFDTALPSYWLLPVEYPDYNSIDSIDSQNVMRFGLRNRLQTKREDGMDNLVDWMAVTDWRLNPHDDQTTFSLFYSLLDFKPRSWITLTSLVRYDISEGRGREFTEVATLNPVGSDWGLSVGHRYREEGEMGADDLGNNLILSSVSYRFSENWAVRATHQFEARDGTMEDQSYTVYRDLRSWTAALTFRYRNNRGGTPDYTLAFTFSLKAFPRYKLGHDTDQQSRLLGY